MIFTISKSYYCLLFILTIFSSIHHYKCQFTEDCGKAYGCYKFPSECQNRNCQYIVKWQDVADTTIFDLFALINGSDVFDSYVAIGFSRTYDTIDSSVSICRFSFSTATYVAETWFDSDYADVLIKSNRSIGLLNQNVRLDGSLIRCTFTRAKRLPDMKGFYDLNQPYYLRIAYGALNSIGSPSSKLNYIGCSGEMQSFKSLVSSSTSQICKNSQVVEIVDESFLPPYQKKKAHSCLMVIAWILFASIGILTARYYKHLSVGKTICGFNLWYLVHISCMSTVPIISITSFIVILSEVGWKWVLVEPNYVKYVHSIFGIVTISLSIFQAFIGLLHPRQGDSRHIIFKYIHRTIGLAAFTFSIVALWLGAFLPEMYLGRIGWGILVGWTIWVFFLPLIIEIFKLVLDIDEKGDVYRVDNHGHMIRTNSTELRNKYRRRYESIKNFLFVIHLLVALAFTVALVVVIGIARRNYFE